MFNLKKISLKEEFKFSVLIILLYPFMSYIVYLMFFKHIAIHMTQVENTSGLLKFLNILMHNLLVMVSNYIGFILSPILIMVNWSTQIFTTAVSIRIIGVRHTLLTLAPYGFIEIITIALYQFLSLNMLYVLYKTKSLRKVGIFIANNYQYYLLSFVGVFVAALLEGLVEF